MLLGRTAASLPYGRVLFLVRFRATAGVMVRRFEIYTGYEYTDIERTHWNGLVAGLGVWF